jgi:uncharacterized protein YjiS (DUF1127 family)
MLKLVNDFVRNYQQYKRYKLTVSELNKLTDRDLADLGLVRCDIDRVARESITVSSYNKSSQFIY